MKTSKNVLSQEWNEADSGASLGARLLPQRDGSVLTRRVQLLAVCGKPKIMSPKTLLLPHFDGCYLA